jgi:hypothetical protein
VSSAALVLGSSGGQYYRGHGQVSKEGPKGVIHRKRGRPCKRETKEKTVRQILKLAQWKYQGFNDHHLAEKLKEHEQSSTSSYFTIVGGFTSH